MLLQVIGYGAKEALVGLAVKRVAVLDKRHDVDIPVALF